MVDVMLESVFLSTVGHRATMSVAHELPAALRTLGLHWSVELGEALVEGGVQFMLRRAASLPPPEATAPKQRGSRRFLVPAKVFLQRKNLHSLSSPPPRSPVTGGPDAGDDDGGFPGTARSPGGAVPPPPPTESGAAAAAPTTPGAARPPAVPIAATPPHMRSLQHSLHATQSAGNLMPHLQLHERARRARTHGVSILDFATFCEICVQLKGHRLFAHEAPRGAHKWSGGTRLVQDVSMDARHFQAAMAAASLNDGVKIKMAAAPRIVTQVHRAFDMQRPAGARTAPAKAQSTGFWASSTATTTTSVGAGAGAAVGDAGGAGSGSGSGANAAEWDARSVLSEATQPDVDGTAGAAASAAAAAPQRTRDGDEAAAAAVVSEAEAEAGAGGVTTGAVAAPPAEDGDEAPQSTPEPAPSVDTAERSNQFSQVFLGGACNPTTWRHDYAMPALEEAGITFFNPQVDEWHPGLVAIEATAKLNARIILFVVASETRGVASMVEVRCPQSGAAQLLRVRGSVLTRVVSTGRRVHHVRARGCLGVGAGTRGCGVQRRGTPCCRDQGSQSRTHVLARCRTTPRDSRVHHRGGCCHGNHQAVADATLVRALAHHEGGG